MTIQTLCKPDGPLASHIEGFKARAPQQEMAEAVARAIKSGGRLLMVANRGLPYEPVLKEAFKESGETCRNARFKVLWGRR